MSNPGALHVRRRRLLLAFLLLGGLLLLGRAFQLQVIQGAVWERRAERQHRDQVTLPSARGAIYDRNGIPLATTRERIRVSVAPREVKDAGVVADRLREALRLDASQVRRTLDRSRRWVVLPGRFDPVVRATLEDVDGVYLERVLERFHPHGDLASHLLGRISGDARPLSGLELELDSLLAGEDGSAVVRRDAGGDPIPGALMTVKEPRSGRDVYLTIDLGLQEIAEGALREAIEQQGAAGGDLIFADPRTGEVLAAASVRTGGASHWRAVTDPYEPGSTMKPFIMAALLQTGRASLADSVFAEQGHYRRGARTITDVHGYGWLTASDVLRYSSNIGMAKLAERLTPEQQFGVLRDLGFGSPTGVGYPSESGGRLGRPGQWSGYSQASIAMGYEISVTPLQMVMAYGALANGGRLMEPRLVREVWTPEGKLEARHEPRQVRRALSESAARAISEVLVDVVEEGTGRRAGLGEFRVAGKTGTARVYEEGRYRRDAYTASFAGFFPARAPQLVFLVKLDRGSEYGGSVAAPVTRATLAAALAARNTPLDRRAVVRSAAQDRPARPTEAGPGIRLASWLPPAPGPYVFRLRSGPPLRAPEETAPVPVPDLRGESVRDAAAALHAAGFRVAVAGSGRVVSTEPKAGTAAARGAVVLLTLGGSR